MAFFTDTTQVNTQKDNTLWVESYRPSTLDTFIGNEHLKTKLKNYLETGDIPHLLFVGKPGTGKTTAAKMIVNSIECDYMIINASDENGIDTIRDKIKGFASTMGFKPLKVIILDESDFLSGNGQAALRNVMETFSRHCRFILTANYIEKIIEPIQSRCQIFQVNPPSKKDIAVHLSNILKNESVNFNIKDLVPIVDSGYPDIRKMINTIQLNSIKGELKLDMSNLVESDYKFKILDILKSKDDVRNRYMKLRQTLIDSRVSDFTDLFTFLYDKVDEYAPKNTANVIIALSQGQTNHFQSIDKEIAMAACLIEINSLL